MKKLLLLAALATMLTGCSSSEIRNVADDFISKNNTINIDNNGMNEDIKENLKLGANEISNQISSILNIDNVNLNNLDEFNHLINKFELFQSRLEYEIKNVSYANDSADIELIVNYVDMGELISQSITQSIEKIISKSESLNKEESYKFILNNLNEMLDSEDIESIIMKEKLIYMKAKRNHNEWDIIEFDDSVMEIITLGFSSYQNELENKISEIESTKIFLEIESNLTNIYDSITLLVQKNEGNLKEILQDGKNQKYLKKVNDVKISFENKSKQDVYHISAINHNKVVISITTDEGEYKLEKDIK